MKLNISYIAAANELCITHEDTKPRAWDGFCLELCDIISPSDIDRTPNKVTFPIWHFFAKNKSIRFVIKNHGFLVSVSNELEEIIKRCKEDRYDDIAAIQSRTHEGILSKLSESNFVRKLTSNQLENLTKISHLPGAADFSVPGAGKTTEALAFFFLNALPTDRLLVIAPKNAFGAWDEQLPACYSGSDASFVRLRGGAAAIADMLSRNPRFMLITYDQLPNVETEIACALSGRNVFVFLDESHRIKGGSQRRRAEVILRISHLPKRKLIMSGTPMPQSANDLMPQFSFLYPSKSISSESVIECMQKVYVRTTKNQLGIPPIFFKTVTVKMSELQRNLYNTLKSEMCRDMNPHLSDTSRLSLRHIGRCIIKVMEFVSNPALLANDLSLSLDRKLGELLQAGDGPKIAYVCRRTRELVAEGKKVLIWSTFVKNIELLHMRLQDLGVEYIHGGVDAGDEMESDTREGKIKRFHDDPACMVLVANPVACCEGISLHKVCQYAIYLDRSFNAAHFLQSEDRIHRLGLAKDARPYIEFVECENSVDQVVASRLKNKVDSMSKALNDPSIRVRIEETEFDEECEDIDCLTKADIDAFVQHFFNGVPSNE